MKVLYDSSHLTRAKGDRIRLVLFPVTMFSMYEISFWSWHDKRSISQYILINRISCTICLLFCSYLFYSKLRSSTFLSCGTMELISFSLLTDTMSSPGDIIKDLSQHVKRNNWTSNSMSLGYDPVCIPGAGRP